MKQFRQFYIDGQWVDPLEATAFDVINPATEEVFAQISLGSAKDVDRAVKAARKAFDSFSNWTVGQRVALLERIIEEYERRFDDVAWAITTEMGSPIGFSRGLQTPATLGHLREAIAVLKSYKFESMLGKTRILREPIGVCGFITPWNWPINQITAKLGSAIAAGCTMVVKPSEFAPVSPIILTEILDKAGVPPGVFNLVNGDGPTVGSAISRHPDIDMVSFTGSTAAGIAVARDAAATVKRVHQELGGKSANILLPGKHIDISAPYGMLRAFTNSGQSCIAPARMLVPESEVERVVGLLKAAAENLVVGDPSSETTTHGPLVNRRQFDRVQELIKSGVDEGARVVVGGEGRPSGMNRGNFVKPTVFADVTPDMRIAREEIFGPVLAVMAYRDVDHAIEIANDSIYGLAGFVSADDLSEADRVGRRIRAGRVYLNDKPQDETPNYEFEAPFGGYKQSGNGREVGLFGFEEFHEVKAVIA
ncbi:aldehyde dehydrogenase family protein [Undibacter mobilis]|uniref:aldehyde dehydrogenase (NAD(+)) n=1 Tax=Undibacter mobilis TaxID=2292256 RepID=A0A371BBG8_9BRAD|nr:aldehyde dehydrogenase family protein [Undibacter mobilis]RDV04701.1 aldehyde dehydrogenase family protein [Undibacter mobilis]